MAETSRRPASTPNWERDIGLFNNNSKLVQRLLFNGVSQGTRNTYFSGEKSWLKFCLYQRVDPWPAPEYWLAEWLAIKATGSILHSKVKGSTLETYLAGVRLAHVLFEEAEGLRLAAALGEKGKVMILRNHGLLTVGGTVDEAAFLFTLMEKSCQIQLAAEAVAANGLPKMYIDDEAAAYTFRMTSDSETHYCEFQPDLEMEDKLCGGNFRL